MTARRANLADLPFILSMCEDMHEESRYARLPRDMAKIEDCIRRLIEAANGLVFVTGAGFLVGFVTEYWFSQERYAAELLLYVSPESRGSVDAIDLVRAYVAGAKSLNAREVHLENSTGYEVKKVEEFFSRCGFTRVGGNYILEL